MDGPPQAEDRLTQLAGSVLQNGFSGYEQIVSGREVIWSNSDCHRNRHRVNLDPDVQSEQEQQQEQGQDGKNKPFALLVLEGSVTAFFGKEIEADGDGEVGAGEGESSGREQILEQGGGYICEEMLHLLS